MARYTGPKCRLCRREGAKLNLKGARCESDKCAFSRRQTAPGVHGAAFKRKPSEYGIQLREKQKTKRIYGILEKQFRNYFNEAAKKPGVTGEHLLQALERRMDNAVYRANLASSRAQARKLISEGRFLLNDKKVNIPSIALSKKDKVSSEFQKVVSEKEVPVWLKQKGDSFEVIDLPAREDIKEAITEQLIVEFYSR